MSKKIVFKVSKDGDVVIDKVEGYGAGCLDITKNLERALGTTSERKMTEEYNEPVQNCTGEHIVH